MLCFFGSAPFSAWLKVRWKPKGAAPKSRPLVVTSIFAYKRRNTNKKKKTSKQKTKQQYTHQTSRYPYANLSTGGPCGKPTPLARWPWRLRLAGDLRGSECCSPRWAQSKADRPALTFWSSHVGPFFVVPKGDHLLVLGLCLGQLSGASVSSVPVGADSICTNLGV